MPLQYSVTLTGIINGATGCPYCGWWNGTHLLNFVGFQCEWAGEQGPCLASAPGIDLRRDPNSGVWRLDFNGCGIVYTLPDADWNCLGPNTLFFDAAASAGHACNNLPSQVDVIPV